MIGCHINEGILFAALADDHTPNGCDNNMDECFKLQLHFKATEEQKSRSPHRHYETSSLVISNVISSITSSPQISSSALPPPSLTLANNPLVSKLLRQPLGTQIALDQANLFCKGDLFNHLIFFGGHLFIWFPRLQRTLRGYSNKAGESNR